MNDLQEIVVVIDKAGNVHLEVQGVKGAGCRDMTEALEQLLGGQVVQRRHTGEYDEQPAEDRQDDWQRQGNF
jgi:hypothetical protein